MKSTQARTHQALFAYRFKDGMDKKSSPEQFINNSQIKSTVMQDFVRLGATQKFTLFKI